jgi:hypothetical protein
MIEKAVFVNGNADLRRYSCFYIGSEFCENRIPDFEYVKKLHGKYVVLLTPIVTDSSVNKIMKLIEKSDGIIKEVVVNDIGLFRYLKGKVKMNIGRILFVNMNYSLGGGVVKKILMDNINAIEADPFIIKKYMFKTDKKFHIHLPFSYLAHSKNCSFKKKYGCRYCNDGCIKIKSYIGNYVYMCFNGYFFRNEKFEVKNLPSVKRVVEYNLKIIDNL